MAKMNKDKYLLPLFFIFIVLMIVSITNHLTVLGSIIGAILLIYVIGAFLYFLYAIFDELIKKPFKKNDKDKRKD